MTKETNEKIKYESAYAHWLLKAKTQFPKVGSLYRLDDNPYSIFARVIVREKVCDTLCISPQKWTKRFMRVDHG